MSARPLMILGIVYLLLAAYFAFFYPPVYMGAAGSLALILIIIDLEFNKLKTRLEKLEAGTSAPVAEAEEA